MSTVTLTLDSAKVVTFRQAVVALGMAGAFVCEKEAWPVFLEFVRQGSEHAYESIVNHAADPDTFLMFAFVGHHLAEMLTELEDQ